MAKPLSLDQAKSIIALINEQSEKIEFGKVIVEVNIISGRMTNAQAETRKSMNLNSS